MSLLRFLHILCSEIHFLTHNLLKYAFCFLIAFLCPQIPFCSFLPVVLFRILLVSYAVGFIPEVVAEEAILASRTIETEEHLTRVFQVETVDRFVAGIAIHAVDTFLTIETISIVDAIFFSVCSVRASAVFCAEKAVTEVAILREPCIVGILTILIIRSGVVSYRTLLEKFFCLRKKCLIEIEFRCRRKCRFVPFVFVPDRVGTIRPEY